MDTWTTTSDPSDLDQLNGTQKSNDLLMSKLPRVSASCLICVPLRPAARIILDLAVVALWTWSWWVGLQLVHAQLLLLFCLVILIWLCPFRFINLKLNTIIYVLGSCTWWHVPQMMPIYIYIYEIYDIPDVNALNKSHAAGFITNSLA